MPHLSTLRSMRRESIGVLEMRLEPWRSFVMTKTPRTDRAFVGDPSVGCPPEIENWSEAADFARRLELELATMTKVCSGYRDAYEGAAEALRHYRRKYEGVGT